MKQLFCKATKAAFGIGIGLPQAAHAQMPASADLSDLLMLSSQFDLHKAAALALVFGPVAVGVGAALLLVRERRLSVRRERVLLSELASLRAAEDRARLLLGSERQILLTWSGRHAEARFEGDPSIAGEGATTNRVLAFGSWLVPADAARIDSAVDSLKKQGETFRLAVRTLNGAFVDAEGRTLAGHAMLRLRDVTGERAELMRARSELSSARGDLRAITSLVDSLAYPLWLRDGHNELIFANKAYLQAVEASSISDASARHLELFDKHIQKDIERRRAHDLPFESRITAVIAGRRQVLDVAERPTPAGWAGAAMDVSELESIQADLGRQMDAHVRTLDQLPTAVAIFDAQERLTFANAAYQHLWGLEHSFLESHPTDSEILERLRVLRKLPEEEDFRQWRADILSSYQAVESRETWWHLPDRRTLRVVVNPNPQGGVTYLFDDVSERFQLESQVTALTRVQSETLDTLKEGVAVFGMDGRLKLSNRAFARMWSFSADILADQPHIDSIVTYCRRVAPDDEPWMEIRGAVAGLPDMRTGLDCRMECLDGSAIDCTAQPLPDGATLLTFVDVTDSVSVERALLERNEALERASRLRDDFVHHVSYELRSPLTNIIGFTQLLGDEAVGALNPRQREYAEHITRSSASLLTIINDILDLASIDTGSLELVPGRVDIRATIEGALRGLGDRLAESSLNVSVDAPEDIGFFVADGKRIRQILFNLLSNAVGFSSPGQTIVVSARKTPTFVTLTVKDEGRGMSPEMKARVFERFESHSLGTRHRGVGLGLAIVRSFVELHGGEVVLVSNPGEGTIVTCTFPHEGGTLPSDPKSDQAATSPLAAE